MRPHRVGIGDDGRRGEQPAFGRDDPRGPALAVEGDFPHVDARPELDAQLAGQADQRSATARVPPRGYQTPSSVCMCAMPHSTAGEGSGAEPTYCVKWSSICATRGSRTCDRIVAPTVLHGRMAQHVARASRS